MTSDRKRAANRRNAHKSTGPTSAAGKSQSSRNALSHGLAVPISTFATLAPEIDALARLFCGVNGSDASRMESARVAAEAHLDLRRVREARQRLLNAAVPLPSAAAPDAPALPADVAALLSVFAQLQRLERYERRAQARRRAAIDALVR